MGDDRIELDERGGLLKTERREPFFALDQRGHGHVWHRGTRHALHVPPETFAALAAWIVEEQGFFDLREEALLEEVRAQQRARGSVSRIMDAATTRIRVVYQGRAHEVSYYALDFYARSFPEIAGLQQLEAIAKRLRAEAEAAYRASEIFNP